MSYILFYSTRCEHSKKFINILEKSGESTFFVKICADIMPGTNKRTMLIKKHGVKRVPTIIVNEQHLVGKEAFRWLIKQIENREMTVNTVDTRMNVKNADMRPANNLTKMMDGEKDTSLQSFNFQNSFIDDTTNVFEQLTSGNNHNSFLSQAFVNTNEDQRATNGDLPTELKSISISNDKLKAKQIENRYNQLCKERENSG